MRRATALLSAAAIVLTAIGVSAQAKPSFAGKWVREAPAAGAPAGGGGGGGGRGGGGGGFGMTPTVTQDDKTLTIEYTGGGQNPAPMKLVFKLDGTESTNQVMGRGGEPAAQVSTATWKGSTPRDRHEGRERGHHARPLARGRQPGHRPDGAWTRGRAGADEDRLQEGLVVLPSGCLRPTGASRLYR